MPLEVAVASFRPNTGKTLPDFSGTIKKAVVGLRAFNLSFGVDHNVQEVAIEVTHSYSGKQIEINVNATLSDDSGNTIDTNVSSVEVVALVWTDVDVPGLTMDNVYEIDNGTSSTPITVACTNPMVRTPVLSGFDLSYTDSDHHVTAIEASTGTVQSADEVTISAEAKMYDDSGNVAALATVDAGLLSNCDPSIKLQVLATGDMQNIPGDRRLDFDSTDINTFQVLMTGFRVEYANKTDHEVTTFGGSVSLAKSGPGYAYVNGATYINDDSDNRQSEALSYTRGIVVGYAT